MSRGASAYWTIWRWHFYAGLFVLPFVLLLSVTGAIYLFKPQLDRWEERAFTGLSTAGAVPPDRQLAVVLDRFPGARLDHYRLPHASGGAAMLQTSLSGGAVREVFVSPQGDLLGSLDPEARISAIASRAHGSLLLGEPGDWLVELAASWTIVMILSGLYLWWPRPFAFAGTFWPRVRLRGRPLLKDLHRVTGFWIAGLVLVMLVSGLPWASAWGNAFQWARTELGLVQGAPQWKRDAHNAGAGHHHGGVAKVAAPPPARSLPLSYFVEKARAEHLPFPVLIVPPHAAQPFGPPTGDMWTVKTATQNRPLTRQVTFDPVTGAETGRGSFADKHIVDRAVSTGIAFHEGQLFGWANQLLGLLTALALIAVSLLGTWMWLKRRPQGSLSFPRAGPHTRWIIVVAVVLGLLLPLFGASLILVALIDLAWTRRHPA